MMFSLAFTLLCFGGFASATVQYTPEQIHIATGSYDEMTIVWTTPDATKDSVVFYGGSRDDLKSSAKGSSVKFVDAGSEKRTQYIHTVIMKGLAASTTYFYMVGSRLYGVSAIMSFKTWPAGEKWSPRLAVFGDMGNSNAKSLTSLEVDAARGMYDAVLHVGDFAYNMDTDNARTGDAFMRQIESLASSLPYMTCPGNHESAYNFSNYKNRFRMPGDVNQRMFYSFKMGPMRIISTSTEYIFNPQYGLEGIMEQYQWLENELKDANLPENRAKQPWVITMGHRPMYCTNKGGDDCTKRESLTRTGLPVLHLLGWEQLFYEQGVDVALWAHEHSYERLLPVYNWKVMNGSTQFPYVNPKAPVHIITGSAGCSEGETPFRKNDQDWSAFRAIDYGYARMQVFNATHLYLEQVSIDKGGKVIDNVWVVKDKHGPYEYDPTPVEPISDQTERVEKWVKILKDHGHQLP